MTIVLAEHLETISVRQYVARDEIPRGILAGAQELLDSVVECDLISGKLPQNPVASIAHYLMMISAIRHAGVGISDTVKAYAQELVTYHRFLRRLKRAGRLPIASAQTAERLSKVLHVIHRWGNEQRYEETMGTRLTQERWVQEFARQ